MHRIGLMLSKEEAEWLYQKVYSRDYPKDPIANKIIPILSDIILDLGADGRITQYHRPDIRIKHIYVDGEKVTFK